ncbi:MAG TPA: hypothetical protein VHD56_06750 [Tepidisphaeraceae bacterium]|nr:hypothetical protein [Tepidisphaeraceae bacterium]
MKRLCPVFGIAGLDLYTSLHSHQFSTPDGQGPEIVGTRTCGDAQPVDIRPSCAIDRPGLVARGNEDRAGSIASAQLIEKTSKIFKIQQLLAALMAIAGVMMCVAGANMDVKPLAALGALALFGGLAWFTIARILAWWFHG